MVYGLGRLTALNGGFGALKRKREVCFGVSREVKDKDSKKAKTPVICIYIMNLPTLKLITEALLLEKYISKKSHFCLYCNTFLRPREVVVNKNHLYKIGQLWVCDGGESKIWTNSIRDEKRFIDFLDGKRSYTSGFCNDKYDGYGLQKPVMPLKNGYLVPGHSQMADIWGVKGQPPNDKIAVWRNEEHLGGDTEEIKKWYREHRADIERLMKTL